MGLRNKLLSKYISFLFLFILSYEFFNFMFEILKQVFCLTHEIFSET